MRVLALAAILTIALFFLVGCDNRKCLEGHNDFIPMWVSDGKGGGSVTIIPTWVCDRYEESKP
ncbi:hypothetical protein ACFWOT_09380 [Streptomyces sp. NPDC058440]|uniref:hypothetical protein n=1 Tax=Streptomyces sp. NPDC058440 TaxID=3346501 RepID=UPI00366332CD